MKEVQVEMRNLFDDTIEKNKFIVFFVDNIDENTDWRSCICFLQMLEAYSVKTMLKCASIILSHNKYKNDILNKFINNKMDSIYDVLNYHEAYLGFLNKVLKHIHDFSDNVRLCLLNFMENLFAYGLTETKNLINDLRNALPNDILYSNDYRLHLELLYVYQYNTYNYKSIQGKLNEIYNMCHEQKLKHLYGMIYYYFAVLEVLSNTIDQTFSARCIDKACKHRYPLAEKLKNNIKYTN